MPFAFASDLHLVAAALALGLAIIVLLSPSTRRTMDPVAVIPASETSETPHEPSIADVLVVKAMLTRALALPVEIVDAIADLAEYWPHSTVHASFQRTVASHRSENVFLLRAPPLGLRGWDRVSHESGNTPITRTPLAPEPLFEGYAPDEIKDLIASPIPMLAQPCRRIVFTIRSHDQGWGGAPPDQGTYNGSWTWFEAGLERWCKLGPAQPSTTAAELQSQQPQHPSFHFDSLRTVLPEVKWNPDRSAYALVHELQPRPDLNVQCNQTAEGNTREHRVVWSYNDDINPDRDTEAAARLAQEGRGTATGNGKFVRDLKLGDVVTLWAKARFPGWSNHVESVKIDVYYVV
ncbi:hypothetical protein C8A05DRAFT_47704 [Staphylotrichum tortipilum]|uniref:Uncharacterized protein n=1 Tax=Staphylotrichum tortipilum TaxID=2831512 RepID=A0AAN6MCY6_9PEZI|nr:hypothetical protein C8A05DRAFT_47704 [Staphylotrichum longicolle]